MITGDSAGENNGAELLPRRSFLGVSAAAFVGPFFTFLVELR